MKQEIEQFYTDNNIPIGRLLDVGINKKGLSHEAIKEAAKELHREIADGREVRNIRLAWEVFAKAKEIKINNNLPDYQTKEELMEKIGEYEDVIQLLKEEKAYLQDELSKRDGQVKGLQQDLDQFHKTPWYRIIWQRITK